MLRLGYEICGGQDFKKIIPFCAAIEILNVSTYTINRIFDEKGGFWNKNRINNNIISGIIQREIANELILESKKLVNYDTFIRIQKLFNEINKATYFGQYIDLNILRIKKKLPKFDVYFKNYGQRCYNFGGKFYEIILQIGGLLANGNEKQIFALKEFGKLFGTSLQMVNDIGDFVPAEKKPYEEAFKYYQDQYGDLRQGKLTLPIYYMIKYSSIKDKEFIFKMIGKQKITSKEGYRLSKILIKTHSLIKCKRITNKYVYETKKKL
ncbi:MAG: polyprenyl synthetase family protein, partial [Nanoarchaeota archaeon]|nr:polyprenyl synthetase family protein [Nanoarchaeota archaeon]